MPHASPQAVGIEVNQPERGLNPVNRETAPRISQTANCGANRANCGQPAAAADRRRQDTEPEPDRRQADHLAPAPGAPGPAGRPAGQIVT